MGVGDQSSPVLSLSRDRSETSTTSDDPSTSDEDVETLNILLSEIFSSVDTGDTSGPIVTSTCTVSVGTPSLDTVVWRDIDIVTSEEEERGRGSL